MGERDRGASKVIAQNRKARFDFTIEESLEAGIVLMGSEVKSLRAGKVTFQDAYATFEGEELWLLSLNIAEYPQAHPFNHDPVRRRKLLLHRRELGKLSEAVMRDGMTLVPLELYLRDGKVKVLLGVAKGRKTHDKRDAIAAREAQREMARGR